ncbi:UNVERIFIED_CONTAM: Nuclear transcription factor Y subunit A-7 [Sesamum latifolium]|uniref:Nuclear transcription factor Y subunit n=1 Tax=Sesamum latifolium TaxID=2727402 RepID=A0AAW2WLG1_9LAMI
MTSSVHSFSDNSEADEQQKPSSPVNGMSHPGIASPTMHYAGPAQLGVGNVMKPCFLVSFLRYCPSVSLLHQYQNPDKLPGQFPSKISSTVAQTAYPYPDPYYRSIFAPYDTQPYPAQPYPSQPMQAGVPLPSEAVEEPVFVNAKQYHGILRRRQSRAKAELENKLAKSRKPYLHESRHLHALRRARGLGGRFQKKSEDQKKEVESSEKPQDNRNLNSEKDDSKKMPPADVA